VDVAGPQFRREAVAFALEQQQWVITGGLEVSASGRVLDEHLGLSALMERHLTDSRRGKNVQLPVPDLLRQSIIQPIGATRAHKHQEYQLGDLAPPPDATTLAKLKLPVTSF